MARHALARRRSFRSVVAGAAVATLLIGAGAGAVEAATVRPVGKIDNACYSAKTGVMSLHSISLKPVSYPCPSGKKPVSWGASTLEGPRLYVGHGVFSSGAFVGHSPSLFAETPKLPAGTYAVTAAVQAYASEAATIFCFASDASSAHDDGEDAVNLDDDDPDNRNMSLAVEDVLTISQAHRIAIFCYDGLIPDSDDHADIDDVGLHAMQVSSVYQTNTSNG